MFLNIQFANRLGAFVRPSVLEKTMNYYVARLSCVSRMVCVQTLRFLFKPSVIERKMNDSEHSIPPRSTVAANSCLQLLE